MDLAARLEQLEELVREAKSMPLSSSVLVNREEVLELIAEMKEALPEEIKRARWIVRDREELLTKAREDGERMVEQAREEQLRMARKEEIVAQGYDLSLNRYREVEYDEVEHRPPLEIIAEIEKLEGEIQAGLFDLRAMLS